MREGSFDSMRAGYNAFKECGGVLFASFVKRTRDTRT